MAKKNLPCLVGALLSLVAFLSVGLVPASLYGGYAGHLLAGGMASQPGFLDKALIVFGMGLGVAGVGSLFLVMGAAAGAGVGAILSLGGKRVAAEEQAE